MLAVIGALLLGIGVILFFAANWQAIPKSVKVSLILGSIVAAYGIGYYLTLKAVLQRPGAKVPITVKTKLLKQRRL